MVVGVGVDVSLCVGVCVGLCVGVCVDEEEYLDFGGSRVWAVPVVPPWGRRP